MDDYLKSKRILLVDDEQELLDMVTSILNEDGFSNVYTAKNVKDAITYAGKIAPELAILPTLESTFKVSIVALALLAILPPILPVLKLLIVELAVLVRLPSIIPSLLIVPVALLANKILIPSVEATRSAGKGSVLLLLSA